MRALLRFLTWLTALGLTAALALAVLVAADSRPLVPKARTLTAAERAWAQRWLNAARPRELADGTEVTLTLSQAQADVLAAYLADRLGQGRAAVRLAPERAQVALSLGLPWSPQQRFLNLEMDLRADGGLPRVERARVAGVPLPGGLAQMLADRLAAAADESRLIRQVEFQPDLARVTYAWHHGALGNLAGGLVPDADRERVLGYQRRLIDYGAALPKGATPPLAELLTVILDAAGRADGTDPATENRAALLALAAYVNRQPLRDPADERGVVGEPPWPEVQLRGRHDLAQHFVTSAALATQGGDALSDLVGFLKEAADSRGGSGFSFADLAADRAGTRFGDLAGRAGAAARRVQEAAARGLREADIMPAVDGLPEGLSARTFAATYRDTQSADYRTLTAMIERRIAALPLYQEAAR